MDKYGLIGYPLGHSFSKGFFTEKFAREGIDARYDNYEIESVAKLRDIVIANTELRGLNCTIPHKQAVIGELDNLSEGAKKIGAVNVIKIRRNEDGNIYLEGHNSDAVGFEGSIKPLLQPTHRKALVLGTGGASKAVCFTLSKLGIEWKLVSRSRHEGMFTYEDITSDILQQYTVIVNCSPVGMFPHTDEAPQLPYDAIGPEHLLYDLIYNPAETLFLRLGAERGATVKNGQEMLELQALESWRIWNSD